MQVGDKKTNYIDFIMSSIYTQLTIMQEKYNCVDNVINRNDWTQILEKYDPRLMKLMTKHGSVDHACQCRVSNTEVSHVKIFMLSIVTVQSKLVSPSWLLQSQEIVLERQKYHTQVDFWSPDNVRFGTL